MNKKTWLFVSASIIPCTVLGICPLCTIAAGAGVGLSRWLAIDDLLSGVWLGGLLMSASLWLAKSLRHSRIHFPGAGLAMTFLLYGITLAPLYWTGTIGIASNTILSMDRLLAGIILGSIVFLASNGLHAILKRLHGGTSFIPFQKVLIPIGALIITSLLLVWLL